MYVVRGRYIKMFSLDRLVKGLKPFSKKYFLHLHVWNYKMLTFVVCNGNLFLNEGLSKIKLSIVQVFSRRINKRQKDIHKGLTDKYTKKNIYYAGIAILSI